MSNKQKINTAQKKTLLDFISSKPHLRCGKFSSNFTRKDAQKEWEDIARILNSMPGARKEWKAWRKTWQDILSKTKSKSANIKKVRRTTGGGPPPSDTLDEFEEGVAALLHPHSVTGHTQSYESVAMFEDFQQSVIALPMEYTEENPDINDYMILPPPIEFVDANEEPPANDISDIHVTEQNETPANDKQRQKVNLKTLLKEKVLLKKEILEEKKNFYAGFLSNMQRQTVALEDISKAITNKSNQQ